MLGLSLYLSQHLAGEKKTRKVRMNISHPTTPSQKRKKEQLTPDMFRIFFIFSARSGRGKGESEAPQGKGGGSRFFIENPTRGEGGGNFEEGAGARRVSAANCRILGGGGGKFFFIRPETSTKNCFSTSSPIAVALPAAAEQLFTKPGCGPKSANRPSRLLPGSCQRKSHKIRSNPGGLVKSLVSGTPRI